LTEEEAALCAQGIPKGSFSDTLIAGAIHEMTLSQERPIRDPIHMPYRKALRGAIKKKAPAKKDPAKKDPKE
jgi:hypothetical protein